ncbi:MAG TPA: cell division ATP-binding protein FtsE [Coriobacteriaceae bacterium]|nr:cell division ATP-binding protein FtsE [Coriobacteriaceae bacterium]
MALFGKSSRGAHAAGGRSSKSRGQAARTPQADEQAAANDAYRTRQIDARLPRIDAESNVDVRRNVAGATGRQRPAQTGQANPLSTSSMPAATEAVGSYADLALDENAKQNLGPVVISMRNVTKVYPAQPNRPALANITLDIRSGEFLFLVGHSGSGKSTFIRMLNREIVPTSGELVVAGENLRTIKNWRIPYLRRSVGCVFQDFKLLPNKTAFENVAFALEVIGKSRHVIRTQVPEVLRLVGLEDKMDKLPDQLSGGEQQRVSIARSIVNRPPILICDEPTGNLDPQTSLGIMRLLERINRTGTTILVATHDREMVDQMRRRVLALENGTLVRDQKKGVYGYDV